MTVFFRPCGDITKAPTPRTQRDVELYDRLRMATKLDIRIDESVDFEDWMEPACMLEQAILAGLEIKILPHAPLRRAVQEPIAVIAGNSCRDILIGRQQRSDDIEMKYFDLGWPSAGGHRANHYAELETFHRYAGRKLALADMPGDPEGCGDRKAVFTHGLSSTTLGAAMATLSPGSVIVKQVYPGKVLPLLTYDLDDQFEATQGDGLFMNDVGFHFARFEGDPAALLVQEKITMTHETRFFVISGKVVTGAACIEDHTPQNCGAHMLPPEWEIARNSGQRDARDLEARTATATQLWDFAQQVADEISQEAPELDCYVVDLALNDNGKPLVIELNPAANSGLYAINAALLLNAIITYAEAAPHREPAACKEPILTVVDEPDWQSQEDRLALEGLDDAPFDDDDGLWDGDAISFED